MKNRNAKIVMPVLKLHLNGVGIRFEGAPKIFTQKTLDITKLHL